MTAEGPTAVTEAIEFLTNQSSLEPLQNNEDLNLAAQEHAKDIGPKSIIGHIGSNGSTVSSRFAKFFLNLIIIIIIIIYMHCLFIKQIWRLEGKSRRKQLYFNF